MSYKTEIYLFDEVEEIFWNLRGASFLLEDSVDFFSGQESDLGNTVVISKEDTDLRLGETLFGVIDNDVDDFRRADLDMAGGLS